MKNKGQMTIFIIVGIVIIAIVLLFILFRSGKIPSLIGGKQEQNPAVFFESCINEKIRTGVDMVLYQGGNINPILYKNFKFNNEDYFNISYLCYTQSSYLPCINQQPLLIEHVEKELHDYIENTAENCFQDLLKNFEKDSYVVSGDYEGVEVKLLPGKLSIKVLSDMQISKSEESSTVGNFNILIATKLYDLIVVAQEIVNQEARFCSFSSQGFGIFYPEFDIKKTRASDLSLIYSVLDKKSTEMFRFAVRGCVATPGL